MSEEIKRIRESLDDFQMMMAAQLLLNQGKGGWSGCSIYFLYQELWKNAVNLDKAIEAQKPAVHVQQKAANVANFAMMLAENYTADKDSQ